MAAVRFVALRYGIRAWPAAAIIGPADLRPTALAAVRSSACRQPAGEPAAATIVPARPQQRRHPLRQLILLGPWLSLPAPVGAEIRTCSHERVVERWDASPDLSRFGVGYLLHGLLDCIVGGHFEAKMLSDISTHVTSDLARNGFPPV
jgi:hypothetical protein